MAESVYKVVELEDLAPNHGRRPRLPQLSEQRGA